MLPDTHMQDALKVADNIRRLIASRELKRRDTGQNYGALTVSMGVSLLRADDTIPTLIQRADAALYASKHAGRNRVSAESTGAA